MLNREAQEIPIAKLTYSVSSDFTGLQHQVNNCGYFVSQYFINNTCLDLTVMDSIGVRQFMPRIKDRSGDRVFKIIREYRVLKSLEQHTKDFFDEVSAKDGPVLLSIREMIESSNVFKYGGFTTKHDAGVRVGAMFYVTFFISEDDIIANKALNHSGLGITVSCQKRSIMPPNPIYAAINSGSHYNPFKHLLNPSYSMFRIFANYHNKMTDEYWYNIGEEAVEVEYSNRKELAEGIHIQFFSKTDKDEEVSNTTVKIVEFHDASNKNGFFTTKRDAMLASNVIRTDREKEVAHKERLHQMSVESLAFDEKLTVAKRELMQVKMQTDELNHKLSLQIQEQQNEHALILEEQKRRTTVAEHRLVEGKIGLNSLQLERDFVSFEHTVQIEEAKGEVVKAKLAGDFMKHKQDMEMATAKHGFAMREMERSDILSEVTSRHKLTLIEADLIYSGVNNSRKMVEENTKLVSTVVGGLNTIGKLIL